MTSDDVNDVIQLYYATLQTNTSNLRQYQLTGLTNGGVRALIVKGQGEKRKVPQTINMTWWLLEQEGG